MSVLTTFSGLAAFLLATSSSLFAYLVLRELQDRTYSTSLVFLGLVSVFLSVSSLLYLMQATFDMQYFIGMDTRSGVPLMLLFATIAINGAIWQFREYDSDDSDSDPWG